MSHNQTQENSNNIDWKNEISGVTTQVDAPIQGYPTLQWVNGAPGFVGSWRANGVFFIAEDTEVGVYGNNFRRQSLVTRKGEEVPGHIAERISITVIRARRAWFVSDDIGNIQRFPWHQYKLATQMGQPRGKIQIISAVDGLDSLVALSLKGHLSAHAVERGGWGERARRFLYDPAARVLHPGGRAERLPSLCFRIELSGAVDANGNTIYMQVGNGNKQSTITPIALANPMNTVHEKDISAYIVPRVIRESYETAYSEADEWYNAWQQITYASEDSPASETVE